MQKVFVFLLSLLAALPTLAQPRPYGVVTVSVCNMRTAGDYDAGMATQGVLGMPVEILETGS